MISTAVAALIKRVWNNLRSIHQLVSILHSQNVAKDASVRLGQHSVPKGSTRRSHEPRSESTNKRKGKLIDLACWLHPFGIARYIVHLQSVWALHLKWFKHPSAPRYAERVWEWHHTFIYFWVHGSLLPWTFLEYRYQVGLLVVPGIIFGRQTVSRKQWTFDEPKSIMSR